MLGVPVGCNYAYMLQTKQAIFKTQTPNECPSADISLH